MYSRDYEGDMTYGAVKAYLSEQVLAVATARTSDTGEMVDLDDTVTITIGNPLETNFPINGADEHQIPANIQESRVRKTTKAHALAFDNLFYSSIVGNVLSEDLAGTQVVLGQSEDIILGIKESMDEAGVPMEGRWLTVSPSVGNIIIKDGILSRFTAAGEILQGSGIIGSIYGFDVKVSNTLSTINGNLELVAGAADSIAADNKILTIEAVKNANKANKINVLGQSLAFASPLQTGAVIYKIYV